MRCPAKNLEEFRERYLETSRNDENANSEHAQSDESTNQEQEDFTFTPATTKQEAEEYAAQFVDESQFGAVGVSYRGILLESANAINEALGKYYHDTNAEKLGGVRVYTSNTKMGKQLDNAVMGYSPIRNSLLINADACKSLDVVAEGVAQERALVQAYSEDPSQFTFRKQVAEDTMKAALGTGRATVAETLQEMVNHELGHSLEKSVLHSEYADEIISNMSEYAGKISGYATVSQSEYIAESHASYRKGEDVIDPVLKEVFDSLKKSGSALEITSESDNIEPTKLLNYFSSKEIETVYLPGEEYAHVMQELNTHTNDEQKEMSVFTKAIGNYIYTVENNGIGEYRIIGKAEQDLQLPLLTRFLPWVLP